MRRRAGEGWTPIHAVELLGNLHAAEAVEPMLHVLSRTDPLDDVHDRIVSSLPKIGPPAVEATRRAAASAGKVVLVSLASILARLGLHDDRMLGILLAQLRRAPSCAYNPRAFGDSRALPALSEALDAFELDETGNPFANHAPIEIREAIEELGGTLTDEQQRRCRRSRAAVGAFRGEIRKHLVQKSRTPSSDTPAPAPSGASASRPTPHVLLSPRGGSVATSYVMVDRVLTRTPERRGSKPLLKDARKLPNDALIQRLGDLGIPMSREVLEPLCGRYPSAEEVSRRLAETAGVPGPDGDWVWLCVTVLWERWFPEIPNLEMIDDKAQLGYANLAEGKTERACDVWAEYWRDVQWLMKKWDIATIAGFDKLFGQTEYLYNWCNDYVMELANAGIRKPLYNRRRLEFCRELMPLADANDTLFMENLRRFSAESLATTGDLAGAERLYQEWLDADPKWGWGWIGWSDLYDLFAPDAPSYERAEEPLLRGLGVRGLRGRTEISDRLADLRRRREDAGVKRGAAADERGDRSVARPYDGPPAAGKVGRNDPCPCGSGRKYKRCCGR